MFSIWEQTISTGIRGMKRWFSLPKIRGLKFGIPRFFRHALLLVYNGFLRVGNQGQTDNPCQQEPYDELLFAFKHGTLRSYEAVLTPVFLAKCRSIETSQAMLPIRLWPSSRFFRRKRSRKRPVP